MFRKGVSNTIWFHLGPANPRSIVSVNASPTAASGIQFLYWTFQKRKFLDAQENPGYYVRLRAPFTMGHWALRVWKLCLCTRYTHSAPRYFEGPLYCPISFRQSSLALQLMQKKASNTVLHFLRLYFWCSLPQFQLLFVILFIFFNNQ